MLRAIELSGFKSFADRTRLEFTDGVSALVGPNGSGKSNIVDAIKWVLGERSPKKLRGGEMTDVIFNGSVSRQPLGAAEVTLTFDNSAKTFGVDLPEVHLTRRIYRSGEGEYLINRQIVRLKDIEDMLSGTGLGNQAYSIIEQGRVESLLQSSSIQRRSIFEEAAGISRYNTRKQEFLRKLERSDQQLIRVVDFVSGLDNQLQTARGQAGKAQLYRQYDARLKKLRIQSGLIDYHRRGERCEELQTQIEAFSRTERELSEAVDRNEKDLDKRNEAVEAIDIDIRRIEGEIAATRTEISGKESTVKSQFAQVEDIETAIIENDRLLSELSGKSDDIAETLHKTNDDLRKAMESVAEVSAAYQKILHHGEELTVLCKEKQEEKKSVRGELDDSHRQAAKLAGSIGGLESRITTLQHTKDQRITRLATLEQQRDDSIRQGEELQVLVDDLHATAERKQKQLEDAKLRKTDRAREHSALLHELSEQKQRQSGMRERISVLEDLIRKHEGLSAGVREVLDQKQNPKSPFRFVHGVVADLLQVDLDSASLIELALGPHAQYVVVSPKAELFRHIERNASMFAGRIGFIWLDPTQTETPWMKERKFLGRPGVLGRADRFVKVDTPFVHLVQLLLGRTWIVENISVAKNLYKEIDDPWTNFLTVSGEMLTAEGVLVVGPVQKSSGLITRRAELRTLGERMLTLDATVTEQEYAVALAAERTKEDEKEFETETRQHQKAVSEYDAKRLELSTADERTRLATEQYDHLVDELGKLDVQIQRATNELEQTKANREEIDAKITTFEHRWTESQRLVDEAEQNFSEHQKKTMNAKIELSQRETQLESLKDKIRQSEERRDEHQARLAEHQKQDLTLKNRLESVRLAIRRIRSDLEQLYLKEESTAAIVTEYLAKRTELASGRAAVQAEGKRQQDELNKLKSQRHAKELELQRLRQEQESLRERIRNDCDVDLADESINTVIDDESENGEPQTTSREMEELQRKIRQLGSINHDSIATLESLESEHARCLDAYSDIMASKKEIAEAIEMVETRYREIFEETFEGVRHHFRELFQRLFGGGHADLILEDPTNLMETGVDIVARPPGKDLKSVSLLSGGEKTLTCVALLLAFFRYRPNPVCILDEVDAALDEANIDRFVRTIGEFQTSTQFLLVTHSKKTMVAATTLYGVTMAEPGISKSVSIRFADVGENGEILTDKLRRAA